MLLAASEAHDPSADERARSQLVAPSTVVVVTVRLSNWVACRQWSGMYLYSMIWL